MYRQFEHNCHLQLDMACVFSRFGWVQLFMTPWTLACQPPLSMGFSSKYTGVAIPSSRGSSPGMELESLQADFYPLSHQSSANIAFPPFMWRKLSPSLTLACRNSKGETLALFPPIHDDHFNRSWNGQVRLIWLSYFLSHQSLISTNTVQVL